MNDFRMLIEGWKLSRFSNSKNKIELIKRELSNIMKNIFPIHFGKNYFKKNELEIKSRLPFNSQLFRTKIFDNILKLINFDFMAETGTYFGTTTQYLAKSFNKEVYTSEINTFYFNVGKNNLESFKNVRMFNSDSRKMILNLIKTKKKTDFCFFYLDAHWFKDLPLVEEIQLIFNYFENAVIMIDDFKVEDDLGYNWG